MVPNPEKSEDAGVFDGTPYVDARRRKTSLSGLFAILSRFRCRVNFNRVHSKTNVAEVQRKINSSDVCLDASALTVVNLKTNLRRGDLFVINLCDDGNQKLLMEVDEERHGTSPHPGRSKDHGAMRGSSSPSSSPSRNSHRRID